MKTVQRLGILLGIWTGISATAAEIWQPFIEGGKWGYVDARGAWKIPPKFERAPFAFEKEWVPIYEGKRWGLLGRDGSWLIEPTFENFWPYQNGKHLVVSVGKKQGLLDGATGQFVLPAKYDELCVSDDSSWVRDGDRLGLFGFDGEGIRKPSLPWPRARAMPQPLKSDRIAWFTQRDKWGVLSSKGEILFPARFDSHELGPRDSEGWDHPEGVDFQNGRAWVKDGKKFLLITADGHVLAEHAFTTVRPWSDEACLYTVQQTATAGENKGRPEELLGIVGWNGNLALPAARREIEGLSEGGAVVKEHYEWQKPDGEWDDAWRCGAVDERGCIVVKMGRYDGIAAVSEGMSDAWKSVGGHIYEPRAGFIAPDGKEVIAFDYRGTKSFSDGLAAVSLSRPGTSSGYIQDRYYGFIDPNGKMVIAPEFEHVSPFCRDRAWVAPRHTWTGSRVASKWAMIDRRGERLTDWAYDPPESGNDYRFSQLPPAARLERYRWRGDLAVIARGDLVGLATAEGKILTEPAYREICEFHDGLARVRTWTGQESLYGYIDTTGKLIIPMEYTGGTDFEEGIAWVTQRGRGTKGWKNEGWLLIDRTGSILTGSLLHPTWLFGTSYDPTGGHPQFIGGFAGAVAAESYDPYQHEAAQHASWGYIDRQGHELIWKKPIEP